jgi:hypothetical protein
MERKNKTMNRTAIAQTRPNERPDPVAFEEKRKIPGQAD